MRKQTFPFPKLPRASGSDSLGGMKPMNLVGAPGDFVCDTALEGDLVGVVAKPPNHPAAPPEPQNVRRSYSDGLPLPTSKARGALA